MQQTTLRCALFRCSHHRGDCTHPRCKDRRIDCTPQRACVAPAAGGWRLHGPLRLRWIGRTDLVHGLLLLFSQGLSGAVIVLREDSAQVSFLLARLLACFQAAGAFQAATLRA